MKTLGIKTTIYDLFAIFIPGVICYICIVLAMYFSGFVFPIQFSEILKNELLSLMPNWFLVVILIFVNYIFGLFLSTLSSLIIEKWLMNKIPFFSKWFNIKTILPENIYDLLMKKFTNDYHLEFNQKDMRLLISLVENNAVNSYNTAFVFLTIYGTQRNICLAFFLIGMITIVINILYCVFPIFGIVLILLSIIALLGYIRFHRYYIYQIVSAYINISK